jgi:hypothetical protein
MRRENGVSCRISTEQFVKRSSFAAAMLLEGLVRKFTQTGGDATEPISPRIFIVKGVNDLSRDCVLLIRHQSLQSAQSLFEKTRHT